MNISLEFLKPVSIAISIISIGVVIYGVIIAVFAFIKTEFARPSKEYNIERLRILRADLGTYILLGLELLIASDIIETVVEPGLMELAILGGVVILRTLLSFFLDREIHEIDLERKEIMKNKDKENQ